MGHGGERLDGKHQLVKPPLRRNKIPRLANEGMAAGVVGGIALIRPIPLGHDDAPDMAKRFMTPQLTQQYNAIELRHIKVDQNDVG